MSIKAFLVVLSYLLVTIFSQSSYAHGNSSCQDDPHPAISFVNLPSFDPELGSITVKGKLKLPVEWQWRSRCFVPKRNVPAVVILHGSAGVDFRGDFYASALNAVGIATLEIDMWEARHLTGIGDSRPALPSNTYPDAFAALALLSAPGSGINPTRIGVLGFSWGGVISVASATGGVVQQVSVPYFGGVSFKAHAANYPVCYAYNSGPGTEFGSLAHNPLTGAPLMIQIGTKDDYDRPKNSDGDGFGDGSLPCRVLIDRDTTNGLNDAEKRRVEVVTYEGASHAWDRLMVPSSADDSFAHFHTGGRVNIEPSVDQAYQSRERVVRFFLRNL